MVDFQYEKGTSGPLKVWAVTVQVGREIYKDSAEEIRELSVSCGYEVVGITQARREKPDPKFFLGSGKIQEIKEEAHSQNAVILIFDVSLSPAQQRNIEKRPVCRF